jgi:hypothetical protein
VAPNEEKIIVTGWLSFIRWQVLNTTVY